MVVALYFWAYFADDVKSISSALLVSDTAAALAGLTAIISFMLGALVVSLAATYIYKVEPKVDTMNHTSTSVNAS